MKRYLVIDPTLGQRNQSYRSLRMDGDAPAECETAGQALELLRSGASSVILTRPVSELDVEFWRDLYALSPVPRVLIVPDVESESFAAAPFQGAQEGHIHVAAPEPKSDDRGFELPPGGIKFYDLERTLLLQALAHCHGNQTRAGMLLGLSRDQIRYRMAKYGLTSSRVQPDSGSEAA
jgi:hypothetical protein